MTQIGQNYTTANATGYFNTNGEVAKVAIFDDVKNENGAAFSIFGKAESTNGNAYSISGIQSYSKYGNAQNVFGYAGSYKGNAQSIFGNANSTDGNAQSVFGNAGTTHGNAQSTFGDGFIGHAPLRGSHKIMLESGSNSISDSRTQRFGEAGPGIDDCK